jgi:hypothetical protein
MKAFESVGWGFDSLQGRYLFNFSLTIFLFSAALYKRHVPRSASLIVGAPGGSRAGDILYIIWIGSVYKGSLTTDEVVFNNQERMSRFSYRLLKYTGVVLYPTFYIR